MSVCAGAALPFGSIQTTGREKETNLLTSLNKCHSGSAPCVHKQTHWRRHMYVCMCLHVSQNMCLCVMYENESTNAYAHAVRFMCFFDPDPVINCSFLSLENDHETERASGQKRHVSIFKTTLLSQLLLSIWIQHQEAPLGLLCFYPDFWFNLSPQAQVLLSVTVSICLHFSCMIARIQKV